MKAARFHGNKDIRVDEVPVPEAGPGQVLVSIDWCGICGSDIHEYLIGPGIIPRPGRPHALTGEVLPIILGHEFCGKVIQAPKDSSLKEGQNVMVDPRLYCTSCDRCQIRCTNSCLTFGFRGLSGGGGGLSEVVAVDPHMVYALPDSVDLNFAALIEPLAVAWHAAKQSGVKEFSDVSVLILGGGPIGMAICYVLRVYGAKKIYVSEPTSTRRKQNESIADVVINPLTEKVGEKCRSLNGGKGVDVVFDAAGIQLALMDGMDALRYKGLYVNVAGWEKPPELPLLKTMFNEIDVKMSASYSDDDFRETTEAFCAGKFKGVEDMVTSRIYIDDIVTKGFEELVTKRDDHIKILVTTKRELLA